jgi:hypothetical protein
LGDNFDIMCHEIFINIIVGARRTLPMLARRTVPVQERRTLPVRARLTVPLRTYNIPLDIPALANYLTEDKII